MLNSALYGKFRAYETRQLNDVLISEELWSQVIKQWPHQPIHRRIFKQSTSCWHESQEMPRTGTTQC